MCGRFALYSPYPKLSESQRLPLEAAEVTPRYNVPPGTFISAVRRAAGHGRCVVGLQAALGG